MFTGCRLTCVSLRAIVMHGFGLVSCVCVSIRFSSERSPDLAAHAAERHDITSTDAHRGVREGNVFSVVVFVSHLCNVFKTI